MSRVVRAQRQSSGDKVLVVLRHGVRWRQTLGAIAFSNDRSLSMVLGALIKSAPTTVIERFGLGDIVVPRGEPSADTEAEVNAPDNPHVDQAYYLTEAQITMLETAATSAELEPGQLVDALLSKALVALYTQL